MNIIQFSFPSSGTMVVANIAIELTQTKLFADESNRFVQAFLPHILNDIAYPMNATFARLGSLDILEDGNMVTYGVLVFDKDGKQIYAKQINITEFTKNMAVNNSNLYFVTHSKPLSLRSHKELSSSKKIYVLRDFRDVYHSHIKSVGKGEGSSGQLIDICKEIDFVISARYFDVKMFLDLLHQWKMHVEEFIKNKDEYVLVRYEDLIANPEKAILELANSLYVDIDSDKVKLIAEKYMHKDVWLFGKQDNKFSHYNEKAADSWKNYFSPTMKNITSETIGHLLIELGYEKDFDWVQSNHAELTRRLDGIERKYSEYLASVDTIFNFDSILNIFLREEKIVFFGAGEYLELLLNRLSRPSNAIFIVDENPDKIGKDICGVSVVGIQELVFRYGEYNRICISVDDKYFDSICQKLELMGISHSKIINIFSRNIYADLKREAML